MSTLAFLDARRVTLLTPANDVPGVRAVVRGNVAGRMRLASEAVGTTDVTLNNIVVGSFWRIETLTGDLVASGTAAATSVSASLPAYANGDPKNSLRVKVRKATAAPFYQPFETQLQIVAGVAQSIYVNQVRDDQ